MIDRIIHYISIFLAMMVVFSVRDFVRALTAVKCGDITPKLYHRLTLNPIAHIDPIGLVCIVLARFGWTKPLPLNPNNFKNYKWGRFFVCISGILVNYILAFFAYPLFYYSSFIPEFGYFTTVLRLTLAYIFNIGIWFMLFNLLPIYPLSGFELIDIFNKKHGPVYRFLRNYGIYILYSLIFLSIISDILIIPQIDILGTAISFLAGYVEIPIYSFWGLII